MIRIEDGIYTHSIVHIALDGGDFMACIQRIDGKLRATMRERRYVDKFAFNSLDEKDWMAVTQPNGMADIEALKHFRAVFTIIAMQNNSRVNEVLIESDRLDVFIEKTRNVEWMHTRKIRGHHESSN